MTPDERNMIMGLFDRMRSFGSVQKDGEAEALINMQVRQIQDSAYMLVQSVLVQEQALKAANDRVQQMEARIRDLESNAGRNAQQSSGGGFLGGLFGGSSATSVPPTRSSSAAPSNSPWGQAAQPQFQQAAPAQAYPQGYQNPAPRGGGFFAQAMTTAAGVAGGMMAADAIRNMLGGHHHLGLDQTAAGYSGVDQSAADAAQDNAQDLQAASDTSQDAQQDQEFAQQDDNNDPGVSNTADDSGGWDSGSDSTDI